MLGCVENMITSRYSDNEVFKQKYDLTVSNIFQFNIFKSKMHSKASSFNTYYQQFKGPVAGNFFRVGQSTEGWTEKIICYIRKCTGRRAIFEKLLTFMFIRSL